MVKTAPDEGCLCGLNPYSSVHQCLFKIVTNMVREVISYSLRCVLYDTLVISSNKNVLLDYAFFLW